MLRQRRVWLWQFSINGMTLNKELRDKQMTGVGQEGDLMFSVRADGAQHAVGFWLQRKALW
jgi:hypothetical protein